MKAFLNLGTAMFRRMGRMERDAHYAKDQEAFNSFGHDSHTKTVFVAVDFEGASHQPVGITAFGTAVFSNDGTDIPAANYGIVSRQRRNFLFGDSRSISSDALPQTIISAIAQVQQDHPKAHLVLVGHGLHADLHTMAQFRIEPKTSSFSQRSRHREACQENARGQCQVGFITQHFRHRRATRRTSLGRK